MVGNVGKAGFGSNPLHPDVAQQVKNDLQEAQKCLAQKTQPTAIANAKSHLEAAINLVASDKPLEGQVGVFLQQAAKELESNDSRNFAQAGSYIQQAIDHIGNQ